MKIITLTINPALDKSSTVKGIAPEKKLSCEAPMYNPGGGGINVSRAIHKLGGNSLAIYTAGGSAGDMIHQFLDEEGIEQRIIPVKNRTRENFIVLDSLTDRQFRFGMPGAFLYEEEWQGCLDALNLVAAAASFIVASGSLPEGVPSDFYARVATIAKNNKTKLILDTSGNPLLQAAKVGVFLLKPNLSELSALVQKESVTALEQEDMAHTLVEKGKCEVVVVSLGAQGAMLVTKDMVEYVQAPTVHAKSTVGAGDSMVGAMVHYLSKGKSYTEMIRYGVAAGSAATMNKGTQLCNLKDVEALYEWIIKRK